MSKHIVDASHLVGAPVAAAPADLRENIKALRTYANGYYVRRDEVLAAIESTPAAPGIDLEQFREAVFMAQAFDKRMAGNKPDYDALLALIDASPKGGSDEDAYSLPALANDRMLDAGWPRGEVIDASFDRQGAYADLIASAMQATSAEVGA
jgi:hypothetical protein